jgi:hypothetical protein
MDTTKFNQLKDLVAEGYCNTDKGGRPIYIQRAKFLKVEQVFENFSLEELVQYYV